MPQCLEVQHITLAADRVLVSEVSFTLRRGKVLALLGSSGSGKSLTCAAALDVLPAGVRRVAGHVRLDGMVTESASLRGITVASIMQNPRSAFNPLHTMATHARETCQAAGQPDDDHTLVRALTAVGLENPARVLSLYPFEMSGGMLQRMMIALALLSDAPFIFADEPTTDLDAVAQATVLDLLAGIVHTRKPGLLLVTHDMGVAARLADDVAVMHDGRIVEYGEVATMFSMPQHPVTRGLLAAHLALYGLELSQ